MNNKTKKIALFYGGKVTKHLALIARAAKKEKVQIDLISYNQVFFDSEVGKVCLRGNSKHLDTLWSVNDYDVVFFRTTGKHWEEVDLIINSIERKDIVVVDPLVQWGKPSFACKAWQMLQLQRNGVNVPHSVYGSLWYLYKYMNSSEHFCDSCESAQQVQRHQKMLTSNSLTFPIILKGSGGDRGTRVFKADNLEELEKLVRDLRKTETEEGKRYMLQEFIENDGDYRVLVLGEKVLGVMKRTRQSKKEFRNNFSMGGKVEIADLPENIKKLAVEAAQKCGLLIAGVDVMAKKSGPLSDNRDDYVILEVNKGPQFWGFMEATKIDVPREIVKFLVNIKRQNPSKSPSPSRIYGLDRGDF